MPARIGNLGRTVPRVWVAWAHTCL